MAYQIGIAPGAFQYQPEEEQPKAQVASLQLPGSSTGPALSFGTGAVLPGAAGAATNAVRGADTGGVTKTGATTKAPALTLGSGGALGTGLRPGVAGMMPGSDPNVPDVNPNNPSYVPTIGTGGTSSGGAGMFTPPTFGATDPSAVPQGDYDRNRLEKFAGKAAIAPAEAYDIGPYYGYAFDAGARSLQGGYDAAAQLANAGSQAAALGVNAGQQVQQVATGYGDAMTKAGFQAQEASNQYEQALRGYGADSAAGAAAAQGIGAAGQQMAQQAGAAMGAQGGQFINQGAAAGQQNIADVNLQASQQAAAQGSAYANQLAGIGAQQGPSAAQAQLQSALNQSNAQNLAMARSGRGWGGAASAQTQALAANAAAGQQAANQSAILRAQEEQQRLQMLSSNVGQAAQLQQVGANTALAQQQVAANVNLQEAQQQAQQQQALYGLGLQAQTQGAELGLQGANLALQGNQAYQAGIGQAGQMSAQAAQTDLASRNAYLQALAQGGSLATQGMQAGGELGLQGIGAGAGLYAQGQQFAQGSELQAMQFAAQQQQALAAQANAALQQYGIQKGVAIQQQQMTNNLIGSGIQAAASMGGAAMLMSDQRRKTDVAPAKDYALDFRPDAKELTDFGLSQASNPAAERAAFALPNQPPAGPSPQQQAAASMLTQGLQGAGANMQSGGMNPILQQYLPNGARSLMSDERRKTDIKQLDDGEFKALQGISAAFGPSSQDLNAAQAGSLAGLYGPPATAGVSMAQPDTAALDQAANAFDPLKAYSYRYKEPERFGQGEQVGVMAQDLAKTPAGRTVVSPDQNGMLRVDTPKLTMLNAAAQAQSQDRMDDVESQLAELRNMMRARGMSVGER